MALCAHPAIKNDSGAILSARDGTIFVADADRGDGRRFIVRADEKLTAFIELELAIRAGQPSKLGTHHSLKCPSCPCVSITLPDSS
jgi:hypothetical protein